MVLLKLGSPYPLSSKYALAGGKSILVEKTKTRVEGLEE
jgi:hypothetical protein